LIIRLWHGRTAVSDLDAYTTFMLERAVPDYESIAGNQGCYFTRRVAVDAAHFMLITHWESMEAVKAFAGPEPEIAKYYPEDDRYLLEKEEKVQLYDVFYDANKAS